MQARELSPSRVAREIGVSHVAVGNFIKGQVPKSEHLLALSKLFDTSMESLLTGEPDARVAPKAYAFQETQVGYGSPPSVAAKQVPVIAWARAGVVVRVE